MIKLRTLTLNDLDEYKLWLLPHHTYQNLNAPYYKKKSVDEIESFIQQLKTDFKTDINPLPQKRIITNEANKLIGEVTWRWRSEETNWMEIGIVVFNPDFWFKGIGYQALYLWIDLLFAEKPELVRLGLTTWSGNEGMMKLSKKLGMKKEAQFRNARIVKGKYFDSLSYGILRSEWEEQKLQ
ncbi:GNAT family N-acetyltransferase [Flammeovirga kamogawensis]|uniref:GNAT family N-acetyltransferase n=1 Tax=Flammeovirga kamogawensis TaxID=373891 RepID=A0ABX8GW12_9BACT|nr:GNAT family protein [Flammeovirga kamogawensis]MBB6461225.1 putative hydrolase of HD superfamily [Flammeovirga kamogawensis]QWG07786.1 GNAT family N-acetyltransferase [Flammeovirga kamogawensis]TRX69592.1 GNAT family N-acetyltransferase [Flammeovirga kamogawensis]